MIQVIEAITFFVVFLFALMVVRLFAMAWRAAIPAAAFSALAFTIPYFMFLNWAMRP